MQEKINFFKGTTWICNIQASQITAFFDENEDLTGNLDFLWIPSLETLETEYF